MYGLPTGTMAMWNQLGGWLPKESGVMRRQRPESSLTVLKVRAWVLNDA